MGNRILIIASHPDDEVLGCGGTIRRLANEGHTVHIAILGEGITSRYAKREHADKDEIRQLKTRSQRVCKMLGAKNVSLHGLPDNRFDTLALLDIAKIIEGVIGEFQPSVVYTQHGGDLNIDHVITCPSLTNFRRMYPFSLARISEKVLLKRAAVNCSRAISRPVPAF